MSRFLGCLGLAHALTLTSLAAPGLVVGFGRNDSGQAAFQSGISDVVSITGGNYHTLAIKTNGTVLAWGYDSFGQTDVPAGLSNVVQVAGGQEHSLALKSDGKVVVWGSNNNGQRNLPANATNIIGISAGGYYSVLLRSDGTVLTVGDGPPPPNGLTNVTAVSSGLHHVLALKSDGTVVAWGQNDYGQTNVPSGLSNVVMVAGGGFHSLALKSDGTVVGWGMNYPYGEVNIPPGLNTVTAIAAGWWHSMALRRDGTLAVWGDNDDGQATVPAGVGHVLGIGAGGMHSLLLTDSPFVVTPLQSVATTEGADATLSVSVIAQGSLTYQWSHDGSPLAAAGNALEFTNIQFGQEGNYSVTASAPGGAVTNTARLIISPGLSLQYTNSGGTLSWRNSTIPFVLESTTNLAAGWTEYAAPITTAGLTNLVTLPAPEMPQQFFRLRTEP